MEAFHELCAWTLGQPREVFVHQHVVDAQAVQLADETTKPIALTFGLIGLCLLIERDWTGLEVQKAHMALARDPRVWPSFPLPAERGAMTAVDVLAQPEGAARIEAIHAWCVCVWEAFAEAQSAVRQLLADNAGLLCGISERPN